MHAYANAAAKINPLSSGSCQASSRRSVDAASSGVIRLDLGELAAVWVCSCDEAEWILCEAALRAGLAVGVVDSMFCDVMTVEQACAVLDERGFEHCESVVH